MEQKDIKLNDQEKTFIRELLRETRPEFREKFLELARSEKKEDRDEFMRIRELLLEYVVPKQGELPSALSALDNGKSENSHQPDELWALRSGDLRPERIKHMGFSQRFCEELKKDGLLFKSRDEAEDASAKARVLSIMNYFG